MLTTPFETSHKLQAHLGAGESLLWAGRPKQGFVLRGSDAFLIPFSLLWCGFAVFWEYSAYSSGAPLFFLLFGGIFVVIGLYFVFGRWIEDSLVRRNTYYGVTEDRVLIHTEFPTTRTKSLQLDTISDITLTSGSGGFGTISLGPQHPMASMMSGWNWPGMSAYQSPQLEMITDAKSVFDLIQRNRRNTRG